MTIWGRVVGVLLGYYLLRFPGAVMGFLVGLWFDRGLSLHLHHIPRERTVAAQQAFFTATFSVMGHLAKADGRVSEDEIRVAKRIMSHLELNDRLRKDAIDLFSRGKSPQFDLIQTLTVLYEECHQYPDLLRFFIEIQVEAALADGETHPEKQRILLLLCQQLHFSTEEFNRLWARQWASRSFHEWFSSQFDQRRTQQGHYHAYQTHAHTRHRMPEHSLQDAYGVLGVAPTAAPADIKKAYRKLMNQHHPDKLASRGLPESMMKLAKEKTQQIRAAYDILREARGFK